MSTFPDYLTNAISFADKNNDLINSSPDSVTFAKTLQDKAGFGIDKDPITHQSKKVPDYVANVSGTIDKLYPYVEEERKNEK